MSLSLAEVIGYLAAWALVAALSVAYAEESESFDIDDLSKIRKVAFGLMVSPLSFVIIVVSATIIIWVGWALFALWGQVVGWLDTGEWHTVSILDGVAQLDSRLEAWVENPQRWIGVHKLLAVPHGLVGVALSCVPAYMLNRWLLEMAQAVAQTLRNLE